MRAQLTHRTYTDANGDRTEEIVQIVVSGRQSTQTPGRRCAVACVDGSGASSQIG
jgi:hypothetical protein